MEYSFCVLSIVYILFLFLANVYYEKGFREKVIRKNMLKRVFSFVLSFHIGN
ncbi:hypothetical protein BREVNS_0163 [Brevinematales bacterium NS]|nr:hypothetical protein BREVNS_0163 [Brevinematales bacterium NS]